MEHGDGGVVLYREGERRVGVGVGVGKMSMKIEGGGWEHGGEGGECGEGGRGGWGGGREGWASVKWGGCLIACKHS
jgi:hypothetical protein